MAKGDNSKLQNAIDYQSGTAQNNLNNLRQNWQNYYGPMYNNYMAGAPQNMQDYTQTRNMYNTFLGGSLGGAPTSTQQAATPGQVGQQFGDLSNPTNWMNLVNDDTQRTAFAKSILPAGASDSLVQYYADKIKGQPGANPTEQAGSAQYWANKAGQDPAWGSQAMQGSSPTTAIGGWQNFMQTGGFSPQDIQDMRARSVAASRAAFQQAQDNIDRQRALSGGYSPNYTAAQAKIARDRGYAMSDAMTNTDAALAQLIQQGKLYGTQGLTGAQLGALGGQTGLYGTTPALANTFGNQVLQAGSQGISQQELQNQIMNSVLGGQSTLARTPSAWSSVIPGISQGLGIIGDVAGAFWPGAAAAGLT